MRKFFIITVLSCVACCGASAQLTVEECWQRARENYPLIVRLGLIKQAEAYTLENASKGYLPQVQLTARASYQSDVTQLPISVPGIDVPQMPKDQYDARIEVSQSVWDGGRIGARKEEAKASAEVNLQSLEVDLYALHERVNELFFGILLFDEQLEQNRLLEEDLQRSYKQVSSYIDAGVANQADLDAVKVEQINARQNRLTLASLKQAYTQMLATMIGAQGELKLAAPAIPSVDTEAINRPELALFDAQDAGNEVRLKGIKAQNRPYFNVFAQGGYGQPGLNMLKTGFDPYYIAGLRLTWNFGSLYTKRNDVRLVENSHMNIASMRETFLFNTRLQLTSQQRQADNLRQIMREDDTLVELRENIRRSAEAKVGAGTLSVTEMMREVMAENMAKQNRALHRIQLVKALYDMKTTVNN